MTTPPRTAQPGTRRRASLAERREWLTGYAFILPAAVLIAIFGLFPIGYAIYMSLFRWRIRQGRFIGLENYTDLLGGPWGALAFFGGLLLILAAHWLWTDAFKGNRSAAVTAAKIAGAVVLLGSGVLIALGWNIMQDGGDRRYLQGLIRTVYYGFGSVPVQIALALVISSLLFQKVRGQELFRMLYFLPYVTPAVAGAAVFRNLFSPRPERPVNTLFDWLGLGPQQWLFETRPVTQLLFGTDWTGFWAGPSLALVTVIIFGVWVHTGYNAVIFLAGLGTIPKQLYEAAEIDGATKAQQFSYITVPLLSPVTFYLTVLGFIGTFQAFTHIYVMRAPATRDAIDTASIVIFDTFYRRTDFSMAAAQSVVLFAIILILTLFQNRLFGRKVYRE